MRVTLTCRWWKTSLDLTFNISCTVATQVWMLVLMDADGGLLAIDLRVAVKLYTAIYMGDLHGGGWVATPIDQHWPTISGWARVDAGSDVVIPLRFKVPWCSLWCYFIRHAVAKLISSWLKTMMQHELWLRGGILLHVLILAWTRQVKTQRLFSPFHHASNSATVATTDQFAAKGAVEDVRRFYNGRMTPAEDSRTSGRHSRAMQ